MEAPYFVPDPRLLFALKMAAMQGVDVRVIIPAVPDSKHVYFASLSYARELLQAGIRFYRYQKGFIHAKVIICDDKACSGSAKMDIRSFTDQFEINAIFLTGKPSTA
ncbi:phospholipase D-like domain-containing protein [Paenibacillus apii]|uniref:phospholipase D-like domain-containing protein n=1 Tax=Paenibacillus apii TaxID=1850370 RepID=UPI002E293A96|nr:phospholipase D-like domain-containing protein [Paenibacillus apii]